MATYSFVVPPAWFQYFSGSKLGRHQTRPWTQPNIFKCLLDHADDAPLATNSIECFKWLETPFISWRSGTQYVFLLLLFIYFTTLLTKRKKLKGKIIYIQYTTLLTLLTKIYRTILKHYKSCTICSYLRVLYISFLNFLKGEKPVPIKV